MRHFFSVFWRIGRARKVTILQLGSRQSSAEEHGRVCRLLLGDRLYVLASHGQVRTTRGGHQGGHPAWCISISAAHITTPERMHMGAKQRYVPAALGSNTNRGARKQALGTLPMRNGSWHAAAQPCESANACICNICHTAPAYERPPFPATVCGKVSHT